MKNLVLFIFFILSVALFSFASPEKAWFKIEVGSIVAIQFPTRPDSGSMNGVEVYRVQTEEAIYMALIYNQPLRPDQDPIASAPEFYKGFIRSFIKNGKGTLTDSASFTLDGYKGIKFSYTVVQADGSSVTRSNRTVLIKDRLYSLIYTPIVQPTETSKEAEEYFLNSIEIIR